MIPEASRYPEELDADDNLYLVHDSLRLALAEDYAPGDTSISVSGDETVLDKFPPTGLLTLTEQCSDVGERAISFYYGAKSDTGFSGLELLPGFDDVPKPKRVTHVTQNVMAEHHNNLKDALVAIEEFIGVRGAIDSVPFGSTLEGRINFLRKLVFTPRAWFKADRLSGLVPLDVTFTEQAFRVGDGDVTFLWDFGDGSSNVSTVPTICVTSVVPSEDVDVIVRDVDGGTVHKTYTKPGKYTVSLTVRNEFGEDVIEFADFISAKLQAPHEAYVQFLTRTSQLSSAADATPPFDRLATAPGGPFDIPPAIRSMTNTFIDLEIPSGLYLPGRTYAGEITDTGGTPTDPIQTFTWSLGDDLSHSSHDTCRASYSVGGVYDMKMRVDTKFGSYRITTYKNSIDIIERRNMWLFTRSGSTGSVLGHEFGLISETFKTATRTTTASRDDSFLDGAGAYDPVSDTYPAEIRGKREFAKNASFTRVGTATSGEHGLALLVWAKGGDDPDALSSQVVGALEYEGFGDVYSTPTFTITRPWNWVFLSSGSKAYFLFGPDPTNIAYTNNSYQVKSTLAFSPSYSASSASMTGANYKNGADELQQHVTAGYTSDGEPNDGRFAVYRTAWKDQAGYILRNDGAGAFFRLKSFYKTEGTVGDPFISLKKIPDLAGSTKLEGQLVSLNSGVYFFNNSGGIATYNTTTDTWSTGGPSSASATFRSVQDSDAEDFDNPANTLLATSDDDRIAYLSYDYSEKALIKFNTTDLTLTRIGVRPAGTQWVLGNY